jgi:uncharacterized membrane protein YfhO
VRDQAEIIFVKIEKMKKRALYFLLGLIFILSSWPIFYQGFFKIHDFTHGARIAEMTLAIKDGHFPVRWTQNFGYGYGMPLFEFYGPLPFYVGSLFYWLTNNLVLSVKLLYGFTNLLTLVGSYLLGKKLFKNKLAGIITALAYTLAPYRGLNLYIRGALSEVWGMMAYPWIVWGMIKIIHKEKNGWLITTLSLSALFLSHNISIMIAAPFIGGFILAYWLLNRPKIKKKNKQILRLIGSSLLAAGLSAFYLIPAFFEKNLTQVSDFILSDYFNYKLHFLYLRQFIRPFWGFGGSEWGPNDSISFFLGYGQIFLILIGLILLVKSVREVLKKKRISKNLFLGLSLLFTFALALLLTTEKSIFIWNKISLLEFIQFPWRFLSISSFFIALFCGWVVAILKKKKNYQTEYFILLVVSFAALLMNVTFFRPEKFLTDPENIYYSDPIKIGRSMSSILPDYLPTTLNKDIEPAKQFIFTELAEDEVEILVNRTHEKLIKTNLEDTKNVVFSLAYYPGWQAWINHESTEIITTEQGLIQITIPAGEQLTSLIFKSTPIRFYSDLTSFIGLMVLLTLVFINQNSPRRKI